MPDNQDKPTVHKLDFTKPRSRLGPPGTYTMAEWLRAILTPAEPSERNLSDIMAEEDAARKAAKAKARLASNQPNPTTPPTKDAPRTGAMTIGDYFKANAIGRDWAQRNASRYRAFPVGRTIRHGKPYNLYMEKDIAALEQRWLEKSGAHYKPRRS